MKKQESRIFSIQNEYEFNDLALDIFAFQKKNVPVYRDYVELINHPEPTHYTEIPFLPIQFFKSNEIIAEGYNSEIMFRSSGTGGERSRHPVARAELYQASFLATYINQIGNPKEQVILALLPNYIEQGESSLVYMVDHLIRLSENHLSGFFLNELDELLKRYADANGSGKQVVIFGVSYALLDLAELNPDLSKSIVIETGGMKGRRAEMTKAELHQYLSEHFSSSRISSEYGMTELLSQAYSQENGLFTAPRWMKILIRQVNDPYEYVSPGKTGGINIIDLANLYSCSFIETQDLGRISGSGFEIMGRFDHADLRGCNLLVQ